jgi:hypothetical protein
MAQLLEWVMIYFFLCPGLPNLENNLVHKACQPLTGFFYLISGGNYDRLCSFGEWAG